MNIMNALTFEARDFIVKETLLSDLDICDDPAVELAIHKVIAYYSIPKEYEDGIYD